MRRRVVRPYGSSIPPSRVISLLFALAVMWMVYSRMGDPSTWRWLGYAEEEESQAAPVKVVTPAAPPKPELVVPGPNDLDPPEFADFKTKLELVVNKSELKPREMLLYWQLMEWAHTQNIRDLEQRAARDVSFQQVGEEPQKFQGKLIRLRMHARRVLSYDTPVGDDGTPKNDLGLKSLYELWGNTDDSQSFPYVCVFPELPAGLKVGPDVSGELVFVGYFLKLMKYQDGLGTSRWAPLLIGRVRTTGPAVATKPAPSDTGLYITLVIIVLLGAAAVYAYTTLQAKRAGVKRLPVELPDIGVFGTGASPSDHLDLVRPFVMDAPPEEPQALVGITEADEKPLRD